MTTPPTFSSGAILTAAQMNAVGLWLVKTQTIGTAVASVTVTDAFSAEYDNYQIMLSGGTCSLNDGNITLALGATTTGYYQQTSGATYAGVASSLTTNNGAFFGRAGSLSTDGLYLNVSLSGPNLAKRTFMANALIFDAVARTASGYVDGTTAYTSFTLGTSAGTMTGGTICVYGYRN
jgi:hypothetical protein